LLERLQAGRKGGFGVKRFQLLHGFDLFKARLHTEGVLAKARLKQA
jgi:hypothetical protein